MLRKVLQCMRIKNEKFIRRQRVFDKNIVFMTYSGGFALLIIHLTYGLDLLEEEYHWLPLTNALNLFGREMGKALRGFLMAY